MAGDHDNFGVGGNPLDFFQQLNTIHTRHFDIGEHHGKISRVKLFQCLFAVFSSGDIVPHVLQRNGEHIPDILFIIHQQNPLGQGRRVFIRI